MPNMLKQIKILLNKCNHFDFLKIVKNYPLHTLLSEYNKEVKIDVLTGVITYSDCKNIEFFFFIFNNRLFVKTLNLLDEEILKSYFNQYKMEYSLLRRQVDTTFVFFISLNNSFQIGSFVLEKECKDNRSIHYFISLVVDEQNNNEIAEKIISNLLVIKDIMTIFSNITKGIVDEYFLYKFALKLLHLFSYKNILPIFDINLSKYLISKWIPDSNTLQNWWFDFTDKYWTQLTSKERDMILRRFPIKDKKYLSKIGDINISCKVFLPRAFILATLRKFFVLDINLRELYNIYGNIPYINLNYNLDQIDKLTFEEDSWGPISKFDYKNESYTYTCTYLDNNSYRKWLKLERKFVQAHWINNLDSYKIFEEGFYEYDDMTISKIKNLFNDAIIYSSMKSSSLQENQLLHYYSSIDEWKNKYFLC